MTKNCGSLNRKVCKKSNKKVKKDESFFAKLQTVLNFSFNSTNVFYLTFLLSISKFLSATAVAAVPTVAPPTHTNNILPNITELNILKKLNASASSPITEAPPRSTSITKSFGSPNSLLTKTDLLKNGFNKFMDINIDNFLNITDSIGEYIQFVSFWRLESEGAGLLLPTSLEVLIL